jgi:hypothetical protein
MNDLQGRKRYEETKEGEEIALKKHVGVIERN